MRTVARDGSTLKGGEIDSAMPLASQTRNVGYYAGLTFGVGYCLTFIGIIAIVVELILRNRSFMSLYGFNAGSQIPSWLIASMVFFAAGVICAIYFGVTVATNSKSARDSGLGIDTIASSVSAFSFMLGFAWLGVAILMAAMRLSLVSPVCGVLASVLLFIGFRAYRTGVSGSKLTGAILMLVSVTLLYFVAFKGGLFSVLGFGGGLLGFPLPGPLFSELTLELIALMISAGCAIFFALPILGEELRKTVAIIFLSISGILVSAGIIYFNFSVVPAIDKVNSLAGLTQWIPSFPNIVPYSIWIMFFGFILLGISGIIGLVAAFLPLIISAKQLSTRTNSYRRITPEAVPPPPPDAEAKYCTKCRASMPLDAIYCPKCAHKQP